jgi:hypothetical protein
MDRFRFEVVNTSQSEPNGRSSSVGAKASANKNHKALDKIRSTISRFRNNADEESRKSVDTFLASLKDPSVKPYVGNYKADKFIHNKQDYPWHKVENPLRKNRPEKEIPVEVEVDVPPWGEDDYETKIRRGIR